MKHGRVPLVANTIIKEFQGYSPMKIEGNIVYLDMEGGFWGIIASNGKKFVPINALPDDLKMDGQPVTADVEPVQMLGITMWGEHVKVNSIDRKN